MKNLTFNILTAIAVVFLFEITYPIFDKPTGLYSSILIITIVLTLFEGGYHLFYKNINDKSSLSDMPDFSKRVKQSKMQTKVGEIK